MKICSLRIANFRGYEQETVIEFSNFTALVGQNDIGKSSILEALDIFFSDGKGIIKIDKEDINKKCSARGENEITITVCFTDLPESVVIDDSYKTSLEAEYLLNSQGQFELTKKFLNAGSARIFIHALHPSIDGCKDLLVKKNTDLQKIIDQKGVPCSDKTIKAIMRQSIREHFGPDMACVETDIDISKGEGVTIYEGLRSHFPLYCLFQADRKNDDSDSEVQDPLKFAVKEIMSEPDILEKLNYVAQRVEERLSDVAGRTLSKLEEMAPDVAHSLKPVIPLPASLK
jgi:hypothetical protein